MPQTVPADLLQQANVMLRLARTVTSTGGAALGGVVVAAAGPGWGIAADAISYGIAAVALAGMRVRPLERTEATTVFHDLRVGWRDFWSRPWLWAIVIQFGIVNAAYTGTLLVLGPAVAKRHFHGAVGWAAVLVAIEAGVVVSGLVLLRWKPRKMLRTATFGAFGLALPLIALARPEPLVIVVAAAFASGYLTEIFGVLWDTTYQQEIPQDKLSRLSAYDAIGSWALMPLGFVVAGPLGSAVGIRATFIGGSVFVVVATALVFLSRDVRMLERREQPA